MLFTYCLNNTRYTYLHSCFAYAVGYVRSTDSEECLSDCSIALVSGLLLLGPIWIHGFTCHETSPVCFWCYVNRILCHNVGVLFMCPVQYLSCVHQVFLHHPASGPSLPPRSGNVHMMGRAGCTLHQLTGPVCRTNEEAVLTHAWH